MSIYIYTYNKVSALWGTPLAINPTSSCLAIRPGADHTGVSAWLCGFWLVFFALIWLSFDRPTLCNYFTRLQVIHFCAECLACPLCQYLTIPVSWTCCTDFGCWIEFLQLTISGLAKWLHRICWFYLAYFAAVLFANCYFYNLLHTFTVARRRRLRRNRALARALSYKHSKCNLFLSREKLLWIRQTLASYHSKDRKFIRVISEAMSNYHSEEPYSWRCPCGRLNKKIHIHCPVCRKHWSKGAKHETQPTYQWQEEVDDQHWEGWESPRTTRPRSKSPRTKRARAKAEERDRRWRCQGVENSRHLHQGFLSYWLEHTIFNDISFR